MMGKGIKSFTHSFVSIVEIVYIFIDNFKNCVLFNSKIFKDKMS